MGRKIKMLNFKVWPIWLKSGFFVGIVATLVINFLPDRFSNPSYAPWYLEWFLIAAFMIFSSLCVFFHVDFVSNYQSSEGPWRHILLTTFGVISLFVVFFIFGMFIGIVIKWLKKKVRKI